MNKKIIIGISVLVGLGLLLTSSFFLLKSNNLNSQLIQTKQILKKMQEEIDRIKTEKEKTAKENERLQADAVSYIALNTQLQEDREKLKKGLEEAQKILEKKEEDLQKAKLSLERLEKKIAKEGLAQTKKLLKERNELKKNIQSLEETLKKERGLYHYNLAVAYTQAKFYDEAVDAYEKSLTFNPDNPEAHYNLGLLYGNVKNDPEKAVSHYQRYLELKPNAEDREEVEEWISKLK